MKGIPMSDLSEKMHGEKQETDFPAEHLQQGLINGRSRLGWFLDKLPGGVALVEGGREGRVMEANEEFFGPIGYDRAEILAMPGGISNILYEPDLELLNVAEAEAQRKGGSGEYEFRMHCKTGTLIWFVLKMRRYYEQEGRPCYLMSTWDVNERKLMEEELYVQTERYRQMENVTDELPFDYDVESREVLVSAKYLLLREMHDKLEHFAKEEEQREIIHPEDYVRFRLNMAEATLCERREAIEIRLNISTSEIPRYAWHRIDYKSLSGMDGKIIRIVGRIFNIDREKTERNMMEEQIKRDALTGMLNKAAVKNEIERYLIQEPDKCHGVFLIDIDNFKSVNDTFGHLFGDTVLINIAEKITGLFRGSDVAGRVGGDEFLVFMKDVSQNQAIEKAEMICRTVQDKFVGEETIHISSSVGIALFDRDGKDYDELFKKADIAMYRAKEAGKNGYKLSEQGSRLESFRFSPKQEERGNNYSIVRSQDENFISAAFTFMSHARDLDTSLNMLMERIGRRYHLGVVAVLLNNKEDSELIQTNCWREDAGNMEQPRYADKYGSWNGWKNYDSRGLVSIDDCLDGDITESDKEALKERGIRALVNCRFSYRDKKEGLITFCDLKTPRKWQDFEKETFLEISRIVAVFVSLRSQQQEDRMALNSLKRQDPVTGLLNEAAFKEKVKSGLKVLEPDKVYAIIFTDINDFSYVNENFGYEAGNRILKNFAKVISSDGRVLSCRVYSDLFISFVADIDRQAIQRRVELTAREFLAQQQRNYPQSNMRLSAGIYFIESPGEDVATAIENANLTRKSIKKSGAATLCRVYDKELRLHREQEKRVVSNFLEALGKGQFHVYMQPQFHLQELTLTGAEALVRWVHEDGTVEPPGDFIPVLEKTGYIVELDFYVFELCLAQKQRWEKKGMKLRRLSANFSRRHFEGKGIYHRIRELTDQYRVPHGEVEIEITESLLVSGIEMVKTEMEMLRADGFCVAIDDFGTGYSSLSMLKDIPADIVKIDKSFLARSSYMEEYEFITLMGALIHSVKEEVIFEGIETQEQLDFLVKCGFRYGQGFLYDMPMTMDMFEEKYMK